MKAGAQYVQQRGWLAVPALAVLVLVGLGPFVALLWLSFTDFHFHLPAHDGHLAGFTQYISLFHDDRAGLSFLRSIMFVIFTLGAQLAIGIAGGGLLHRLKRAALLYPLVLPLLISSATVGLVWRLLLHGDYGPLGYIFFRFFGQSLLGSPTWAFISLCVVEVWHWSPLFVLGCILGLNSCPKNIIDAAALDGATERQVFWRVLLPNAVPLLTVFTVMRLMGAIQNFDTAQALTGGGPASTTEMISHYVFIVTFTHGDVAKGAALCVCVFLVLQVLLSMAFSRWGRILK